MPLVLQHERAAALHSGGSVDAANFGASDMDRQQRTADHQLTAA
jgi:hypothetical protein